MNPVNRDLTAGGSSGGEGALIGMRGSILGVGTDIGGSIRVPALCNGLYGVKPSHGRVPYSGQQDGTLPGSRKLGLDATAGPIATSARDCEMLLRVIGDSRSATLDPDVVAQTWSQQSSINNDRSIARQSLRVGIISTDGHVTPLPPVQRVLDEVARTLSASGIEVVEVNVTTLGPAILKTFNGIMSIDGANTWFDHLAKTGESLSPWLQTRLKRRPPKPTGEIIKLQAQKIALQKQFLNVWDERGGHWNTKDSRSKRGDRTLDLLVCPPAPHPVAPIDGWNTSNYTSLFNLLDYPAGVIPVRAFAERDTQGELSEPHERNGWDKHNRELWTKVERNVYMDSALSVQVVAPRLCERRLVEGMAILDEALHPLRETRPERSRL